MASRFYDRRTQYANRYKLTDLGDGTVSLVRQEGEVYQEGTKLNAATLNAIFDELVDLVEQGVTDTQILKAVNKKINDGTIPSLMVGNNSITTSNIQNDAVLSPKIKGDYDNLVTGVEVDKTIDTTTGELITGTGSYVTNAIQVRNDDGLIYPTLYINKWKNDLMWVGYGSDGTTVTNYGNGGSKTKPLCRTLTLSSFSSVYYIRFVGYTDLCASSDFVVTNQEYKYLNWLRLNSENFTNALDMENSKNATARIRENSVFKIDIDTTNSTIGYTALRGGTAYINNSIPKIVSSGDTQNIELTTSTTYALVYKDGATSIVKYNSITDKVIIFAYIYYYNASTIRAALCGNDNNIEIYKDGTRLYDAQVEESIFNHSADSKADVWEEWSTVKIDKTTTPVPFRFNSTVYADGGMFVGRAGDCNVWNTYDNGKGGHAMQLFSRDKSYRFSVILDNRLTSTGDNLPVAALHTWLTDGGKEFAFGWLHLGADMCGFIDGVDTGQETGIYVNPSMSIFNTPVIMKPQALVTNMPKGYEVDENGDYTYDTDGKRIAKDLVNIDGKDILQVNENHELCFHRGDTNKWYKINMTEITE